MALTKTITKIMPTKNQIGVHLKLEDDAHPDPLQTGNIVVIDEDITDNFSGDPTVDNRAEIARKVQRRVNEYKVNKAMYLKAVYTNAVTWIGANTNV